MNNLIFWLTNKGARNAYKTSLSKHFMFNVQCGDPGLCRYGV